MLFPRRRKKPRYPNRSPLPMVRRRIPMRYHMRHQFGVRDLAFLQTMHALTGTALAEGNSVEILRNGVCFFPPMLAAIRAARKAMESRITNRTIAKITPAIWPGERGGWRRSR